MRYYSITITDATTNQVYTPPGFEGLLGGASYTNWVNGTPFPGAWNIEIDVYVVQEHQPVGGSYIRIWGISLQEISQANNLVGKNISVNAGMKAGLPLSNPAQSGLLFKGWIYQAFGNWVGTEMTLDLYFLPGTAPAGGKPKAKNLVWNQPAGQPMATALKNTLSTAYPGFPINVNISPNLIRPNNEVGAYGSLGALSTYVNRTSRDIINDPKYSGVSIVLDNGSFNILDWNASSTTTQSGSTKQINFNDLIGQPTWIDSPQIQFKCAMRTDVNLLDNIKLPKTLVTNTQAAASNLTNQTANFQGGFKVMLEHPMGNFRQPTAEAWVSVFNAVPVNLGG